MRNSKAIVLWLLVASGLLAVGSFDLIAAPRVSILVSVDGGPLKRVSRLNLLRSQKVRLHLLLQLGKIYYSDREATLRLGRRKITLRKWSSAKTLKIQWFKVEPLMKHPKKGNDSSVPSYLNYTNAHVPESPKSGWIGFDKIRYRETAIKASNRLSIVPDVLPTELGYGYFKGLGVMRFAASVTVDGKSVRTPGASSTDYLGIKPGVFTLTVRRDNSLLGWATSFFNIPGIFGSVPKQVDRYIGVDCADLIIGAWRKKSGKRIGYTNVDGLVRKYKKLTPLLYLTDKGALFRDASLKQRVKVAFRPGDVIVFNYPGTSSRWDHVGFLYKDGGDGIVGSGDSVLHAGPEEPKIEPLISSAFVGDEPTKIRILRLK